MAKSADETAKQTNQVSNSLDEATAGVTAAAAASDEFAMSIGEISRQAASSAELARDATGAANRADETISALSQSAEQVGQIVERGDHATLLARNGAYAALYREQYRLVQPGGGTHANADDGHKP